MTVVPFSVSSWSTEVTPDLRRAVEYHEGRRLTDGEVLDVLRHEIDGLVARWKALGRWMNHLDGCEERPRPKLSGVAVNNPSVEERERRSQKMRGVWAQRGRQPTAEARANMSASQRKRWARTKARKSLSA